MVADKNSEWTYKEKRKHERYSVAQGAYAALSPKSSKIGQIVNISRGGLSLRYIDNDEKGHHETHIFLSSKNSHVSKIPIKSVNDYNVSDEKGISKKKVRQVGIQFGEMNLHQLIGLDSYIANNAYSFEAE